LHMKRATLRTKGPRLVVFPSMALSGSSGDLRAVAIAKQLNVLGWRAVVVPPQLGLASRRRILRIERPDLILLQQMWHPLNRPSLYGGTPCIFDSDDADILDSNQRQVVVDCCEQSLAVIAGSRFLRDQYIPYNDNVYVVWTTTYVKSANRARRRSTLPIISWGHSGPLGHPLEAELIREVLIKVARKRRIMFDLYGVNDEGLASEYIRPFASQGIIVRNYAYLPYRKFINSLAGSAIGLHPVCTEFVPSKGKSFGKVLAYLAADVPVVTTNAVDHPLFFEDGKNCSMIDNSIEGWVEACERLLDDGEMRRRMVTRARSDFLARLTVEKGAQLVDGILRKLIDSRVSSSVPN
jgi:hypothetical protein